MVYNVQNSATFIVMFFCVNLVKVVIILAGLVVFSCPRIFPKSHTDVIYRTRKTI